jgi:hypothetical protein
MMCILFTDAACKASTKFDDTSKRIVKDAIDFYDTTKTGRMDFALKNIGKSFC